MLGLPSTHLSVYFREALLGSQLICILYQLFVNRKFVHRRMAKVHQCSSWKSWEGLERNRSLFSEMNLFQTSRTFDILSGTRAREREQCPYKELSGLVGGDEGFPNGLGCSLTRRWVTAAHIGGLSGLTGSSPSPSPVLPTSVAWRYLINLRIGKLWSELAELTLWPLLWKCPRWLFLMRQRWVFRSSWFCNLDDIQWHLVTILMTFNDKWQVYSVCTHMWKMCTCMNESKTQALSFVELHDFIEGVFQQVFS